MRLSILIFFLIFSFQGSFGQEKSKAELFAESGVIDCCHPTFDEFLNEINVSNSIGYIVIYKNKDKPVESYYYEVALKSHFLARDVKNIIFVQGKSEDKTRTEFWKVSQSNEKPVFEQEKWNYSFSNETKPFVFWSDSEIDGVCNFFSDLYFRNILSGNKHANVNVVIYSNSSKEFLRKQKKIQNDLIKNYNIELKRLKFFRKARTNRILEYADYWLVPKKQRK